MVLSGRTGGLIRLPGQLDCCQLILKSTRFIVARRHCPLFQPHYPRRNPVRPQIAPQAPGAALDPETLNAAQAAADSAGETLSAFLRRAVEAQAQRDKVLRT